MGKGQLLQLSWNYKENRLNKDIKKEIFKKDLEFNWDNSPD